MKKELNIMLEILCILATAIVVLLIIKMLGFPVTYDQAIVYSMLCQVARHTVEIKQKRYRDDD